MKKILFILAFFVSVAAHSQTVGLELNTSTTADTVSYDKASIYLGQPFTISGVSYVKIYVTQTKVVGVDDVITRTRILTAPATVAAVLYFDPATMKVVANTAALNVILVPYNIHVN